MRPCFFIWGQSVFTNKKPTSRSGGLDGYYIWIFLQTLNLKELLAERGGFEPPIGY
jgi:hypothetical protein